MAKARNGSCIPVIIAFLIICLILYLINLKDKSPISTFFQWISQKIEGFGTQFSDAPRCPGGFRFFNDQKGDSMCCKGTVDPQTHMCSGKKELDICAFVPGVTDPRNPKKGKITLCSDLLSRMQADAEREFCPRSHPHHASNGKCCANPSDPVTGDCTPGDLQRQEGYCLTTAERKESDRGYQVYGDELITRVGGRESSLGKAEQLCLNLRNKEAATCFEGYRAISFPIRETETVSGKVSYVNICNANNFIDGQCLTKKDLIAWTKAMPGFEKLDIEKSILNCDILKKVKIDKDLTFPADYTDGKGRVIAQR